MNDKLTTSIFDIKHILGWQPYRVSDQGNDVDATFCPMTRAPVVDYIYYKCQIIYHSYNLRVHGDVFFFLQICSALY